MRFFVFRVEFDDPLEMRVGLSVEFGVSRPASDFEMRSDVVFLERRGVALGDLFRTEREGFADEGRVDRDFPAERRFDVKRLRGGRLRIGNDAANRSAAKD